MEFEGWLPFEGQRLILPVFRSDLPSHTIYDISLFEGKEVLASKVFPKYNNYVPLPENLSHPLDTIWDIIPYSEETKKSLSSVIYKINGKDCFGSPNNYYLIEQLPESVQLSGGFAMQIGYFNQNAIYGLLQAYYPRAYREYDQMNVALNPDDYLIYIKHSPGSTYGDLYFCVINKNTGYSFAFFHMALDFEYLFFEDLELYQNKEDAEVKAGINPNPYNPGGTSGAGGGGGAFGQGENSIDITPSIPTGSAEQALGKAGLYTRYLLNRTELYTVGSILWSKNFLQGIEAALTKLFYASPAEMLIQLLSYPFNVEGLSPSLGTSQFVWGNYPFATDIGVVSVLNSPALQFDWGEVQLTEFWGSFLDYAPYTKIDLYLPFGVGFVPIDPNECVPGSIGIKTNFDMNTGAVIHTVTGKVTRNGVTTTVIIGTYCGNAARQVPLVSADISGKMLNVISTGVGLAVAGVQAGLAAETPKINEWTYYDTHTGLSGTMYDGPGMDMSNAQLAGEIFKSISKQFPKTSGFKFASKSATALTAPTPVQRNGSFTSGVSGLGIQFPYIVVSRPDQSVPQQYGHHYGYPSNIYAQLSTLTGYTEVGSIHLENLKCTGEERNELDRLLKEGVFLGY